MRDTKEDPGLSEVKAVLKRLQRLDLPDPETPVRKPVSDIRPQPSAKTSPPVHSAGISVFDKKRAAIDAKSETAKANQSLYLYGGAAAGIAAIAGMLLATGVVGFSSSHAPAEDGATRAARDKQGEFTVLADARRLLSEGQTEAARKRLLEGAPERHADLAFSLAQSYDPNYLRSLTKTDGQPNPAEAERWYRRWYDLAVTSGLEMDGDRLKRIINAMR